MERAACAVLGMDPEIFFPDKTELATKANEAIVTCFNCPVFNECKQHRRATGSRFGIWAGELHSPAKE